jgi:predicted DNA-binding transcriptional regulator YafY
MSSKKVREQGFSKDADKLVRRLSLVALLLSRRGQPVSAEEIRRRVEGYPTMTEDAFKRRFYEDRTELVRLGVEISAETSGGGPELYRLPADAYYLPPVELSGEELTALAACLVVLEDRFAYSQPLRLALLSLAQGRPELIADAEVPPLTVVPETAAPATVLPKLQAAIAERKTVRFAYYAIARDQELERIVDPYGLQLVAGEWYLIGRCHLRQAERTFRLSRIRSRVTHATRAPHDFETPPSFDIGAYRDRPAWQLARPTGTARIRVAPEMAWWVEAHWRHCGAIERQTDGGVIYGTPYADARPLLGWLLGLADAAELLEPVELRERLAAQLRRLDGLLDAEPPKTPPLKSAGRDAPAGGPRRRRPAGDWRVEVDRFTRLTALTTYLLQSCGGDEALLDVAEIRAALGVSAEELRADVRLLNLVNFGADGALLYAEYEGRTKLRVSCDLASPAFRRPARLSPLQADTLLLAVELVGGQLPTASGAALASAAQKLRAARSDSSPALVGGDLLLPADDVLDPVNAAIVERRLLHIEYWAEGTERISRRTVEPYLLVHSRGEWYFVCWCRTAGGTRVFRVATTKSARLLDEHFEPRPDVELALYRREGIPASGSYAPRTATVWYSPAVHRWIAERQPVRALADGSCLAEQPYVDERWLSHHLLRFADQARPLAPPEAVADLRATVRRLLAVYER